MNWTESQISSLIRKIYNGTFTLEKLPKKLYASIAKYLTGGVYKGYGTTLNDVGYDTPDYHMLKHLTDNVHLFSAAKTFNYILSTENLIVEKDEVLPFKEFKKRALEMYDKYNVTWLETEYNTAIIQSQHVRSWNDFAPDAILKYMLTDGVIHAPVCLSMQGVTRPKNDPVWRTKGPQNHFGCLCYLDASYDNVSKALPNDIPEPDKGFDFNPAIEKKVFSTEHPYFDVPAKYKKYAKQNFGLPL